MEENKNQGDNENEEEKSSGVGGSRWNPTKEQIEMLERIYSSEGVRTPSAEQIQQITARLRVYGHIEGKNVFYWFQNHKARQRQKQRLERLNLNAAAAAANSSVNHHINPFLSPSSNHHYHTNPSLNGGVNLNARPIFPAPSPNYHHHYLPNPNVICSQYYHMPQGNIGFYNPPPQHHYSAPAAPDPDQTMKRRPSKSSNINKSTMVSQHNKQVDGKRVGVPPESTLSGYTAAMMKSKSVDHHHHPGNCMGMKILNLFPLHPTGILEHKIGSGINNNNNNNNKYDYYANNNYSCATSGSSVDDDQHPHLFDFFSSSGHAISEN